MQEDRFPASLTDDILTHKYNYFEPILADALSRLPRNYSKIVDIGCGSGHFSKSIISASDKYDYVGVDGSEYALDLGRKNGMKKTIFLEDLNCQPLPISTESVDLVIAKDLLEHLVSPRLLLRECHRVLMTNGYFLCLVPNHFTLRGRIKLFANGNIDTYNFFPDVPPWDYPHLRFYSHSSVDLLFASQGFKPISCYDSFFADALINNILPKTILENLSIKFPDLFATAFCTLYQKT